MRIMVDTNVLVSALLLPASRVSRALEGIVAGHTLVLASFVIDELRDVVERKFPGKASAIDRLLDRLSYETAYTPRRPEPGLLEIRDAKDYPVLYTAMTNGVDILVTGDKDFAEVRVDRPRIMTPAQFCEEYL